MSSTNRVDDEPYYGRFFAGYCLILPDGHRLYADYYLQYIRSLINRAPSQYRGTLRAKYEYMSAFEDALENQMRLPEEYLLGILEVYSRTQACCVAWAESKRLQQRPSKRLLGDEDGARAHLDLFLITNLSLNQPPCSDISKQVVYQARKGCICLFCIPGLEVTQRLAMPEQEIGCLEALLQQDLRHLNIFIPCRRLSDRTQHPLASYFTKYKK